MTRKGKWGSNRTVTQMLWTGAAQNLVVVFFGAMRPYLLVKDSRFPQPLRPHTLQLTERRGGACDEERCCPILRRQMSGGGAKSTAKSCKVRTPEGIGTVEWLARVFHGSRTKCCPFFRRYFLANGRRTKCCPFFPFDFSCHA